MNKLRTIKASLSNQRDNFFELRNSLDHLAKISKRFYVISVGFEEIFYGYKNSRRFKLCVLSCIYCWLYIIGQIVFISNDKIYSQFDGPFVPHNFRTEHILAILALGLGNFMKTELLIGEMKYNLKPLRMFYNMMNNWKYSFAKYNLNNDNYKRLAYSTRISQTFLLDYGAPIFILMGILILTKTAVLSGQLFWYLEAIHVITFDIFAAYSLSSAIIIIYIYFSYYKLLFDQINVKIKEMMSNGKYKVIIKRREEMLMNLIQEHNQFSNEIHQMNLIIRRIAAVMFVSLSFVRIISLYLLIHMKTSLLKFAVLNGVICSFLFAYSLNHFLSKQIKSAHQSQKFVYSIICRYKMSFNLRMKLTKFYERLAGPSIGLYCYNIAPYDINTFYKVIFYCKLLVINIKLFRKLNSLSLCSFCSTS